MLHKAEEWNLLGKVPKSKLLREHGRRLRLDDDAEQKLLVAASACRWKPSTFELFRDVIILARDTGMRNQREFIACGRRTSIGTTGSFLCQTAKRLRVGGRSQ
jgi:hypothetical protein